MSTAPRAPVRAARAAAALVLVKAAISLAVIALGFSHVSDDDYARVVIAQGFAVAPRLDPSGTSWLPLPFWLTGGAMIATGRSLLAARIVAVIVGAVSPLPAFFALRRSGVGATAALVGLVLASASPWSAWSAAATIPDGWTAALVAAAAFGLMPPDDGAREDEPRGLRRAAAWAALAALARYEAWPLCAVVAARSAVLLWRRRDLARPVAPALLLALAAPLAWMVWNLYAHGEPLHFLARVATFRRQIGAASAPLATKLAEYPRALWGEAPDALLLGAVGVIGGIAAPAAPRARLRRRWGWPVLAAVAITVFLVVGDVRDGAPTHHPVRPLLGVVAVLVVWGVDTIAVLIVSPVGARPRRRFAQSLVALLAAAAFVRDLHAYRDPPGTGEADRTVQIRRGSELRATTGGTDVLQVTPCAYEHFALLASFAAPERAVVAAARPPSAEEECPRVSVEAR